MRFSCKHEAKDMYILVNSFVLESKLLWIMILISCNAEFYAPQ